MILPTGHQVPFQMRLSHLNQQSWAGLPRPAARTVKCRHIKAHHEHSGASKLLITNRDLFGDLEKVFPNIIDRSINGIYLSNERSDVDKHLQNRGRKVEEEGYSAALWFAIKLRHLRLISVLAEL